MVSASRLLQELQQNTTGTVFHSASRAASAQVRDRCSHDQADPRAREIEKLLAYIFMRLSGLADVQFLQRSRGNAGASGIAGSGGRLWARACRGFALHPRGTGLLGRG